jgi:hypothetical protein
VNRHLRNTLSWSALAVSVWGILLVVPDWFGRPDWGWWLVTGGAIAGLAGFISTFHLRDHETGVVVGAFGYLGFASLLGGLAIVTAAIVRLNAMGDHDALGVGFGCLVVGGLIGISLLGSAVRLIGQAPGDPSEPGSA